MTIAETRLDELVNKSPEDMTDEELEAQIRNIRHVGIQRATRKAESRKPATAAAARESKAIKDLRTKLEAAGTPATKIEQIITIQKQAMKATKK